MMMKKSYSAFYDTETFAVEVDPLAFRSKEAFKLTSPRMGNAPLAFGLNGGNEYWNAIIVNGFSKNSESRSRDSVRKKDESGHFYHLSSQDGDSDSLFSVTKDENKQAVSSDLAKGCDLQELMRINEEDSRITGKDESSVLREEPFAPSIQLLRSFLSSLSIDRKKSVHSNENFATQLGPRSSAALSPRAEPGEDVEAGSRLIDSREESGGVNLDPSLPVHGRTETARKQLVKSGDTGDHENEITGNLTNTMKMESTRMEGSITGILHEQCLDINHENYINGVDENSPNVRWWGDEVSENSQKQSHDQKDGSSGDNFSDNGKPQFVSCKNESSTCLSVQIVESKHEGPGNFSITSQMQYDQGESSFSANSFATYSGLMARSGSISRRSEGSAASARSFTFPILQSEWNWSPIRMEKAEKRPLWKPKSWKPAGFCCRF